MRDSEFSVNFTFHNVGQGLFYSGRIGNFNLIYDCGSDNKGHIKSVLREYKRNNLRASHIDLLVLSHLHADHISGLETLLDEQTTVDTVMLPYLSPAERLMVALGSSNSSAELREFWADPISFLERKNVGQIVLFGQNQASPPEDVTEEYEEGKMNVDKLPKDEKLEKQVREKEGQLVNRLLDQNKLQAKKHNTSLVINNRWLIRFFNVRQDDPKQDQFEQCVGKTFPNVTFADIIRDKSRLKKLRECYEMLGGDFNNTSLVLFHGPIIRRLHQMNQCNSCLRMLFHRSEQYPNRLTVQLNRAVSHFLTGDVSFGKWTEIVRHYADYLSRVEVALVPHHGSKDNWSQAVLKDIVNACWVTSAGFSNKHGHPDPDVCSDITNSGSDLQCANEAVEVNCCGLFHTYKV